MVQTVRQWLARLRQFRRQQREGMRQTALDQVDAAALATQAAPDASRLLLLRLDSIGDYLLWRPWLRRFATEARARGQHLTLLANALWAPLAAAWDADCFDELQPVTVGRFGRDLAYRAGVLAGVGAGGYGQVVNPLHVRNEALENFVRYLHASVRVASQGAHQGGAWFAALNAGYTHLLPSDPGPRFEYVRNGEFFGNWRRLFGAGPGPEAPAALPAAATDAALAARMAGAAPLGLPAAVALAGAAEAAAGPCVVLFAGASARQKQWPARHFGQLARQLHRQHPGLRLVLAGSEADAALARQVQQAAGPAVLLDNRCGRTDLPALAALLAGARLVVSNDTVAAHLAVLAGVPTVVTLMGENYGKFFPYPPPLLRAPCRCLFPPSQEARLAQGDLSPPPRDPAIARISVARVLAAANEFLVSGF